MTERRRDPSASGDDERVGRLEAELADRRAEIDRLRLEKERTARELARAQADLRALRAVPVVRVGLATKARWRTVRAEAGPTARSIAGKPRRLAGRVKRRIQAYRRRVTPAHEAALRRALEASIPAPRRSTGPLVSIVMLNRDGEAHLRRCLPAVERTAYRDVELIVVDNGSSDASIAYLESLELPFPVHVIRNEANRPFDEANDQGLASASGELILFLNNDVEPIVSGWLGHMVDAVLDHGAAAVGARLIYPRDRGVPRGGREHRDLTLQHRGITFDRSMAGVPFPRAMGAGEDPLGPEAQTEADVPGATAACLLVRRDVLDRVGGFGSGYDYGLEDVDLCLRIRREGGAIRYAPGAALWHHESSTRRGDATAIRAQRIAGNRRELIDRWGPRLTREVLLDAVSGRGIWSAQPFHVGVTVTRDDEAAGYGDWHTGHELGEALEGLGWQVTYLERYQERWYEPPEDLDAIVALLDAFDLRRIPRRIVTLAWVRNWPTRWVEQPWFDDYDIVLASSQGIADVIERSSAKASVRLPIATNPRRFHPVEPAPELACDVLFVGSWWGADRGIVDALPRLAASGLRVHVYGQGWDQVPAMASLHRGYLPYDRLAAAYASAGVVVDDTAHHALPFGAVNSRVFDAIAAGAVLITDNPAGTAELFGEGLPAWHDAESLEVGVRELLADPDRAHERMGPFRAAVAGGHTYAHRADVVRDALSAWVSSRRLGLRIGVPSWEVAHQWGDLHFARALQRRFERAGVPTRLHLLPDWDAEASARDDATLHLFGLKTPRNRTGQVNLLWQISHPDLASPDLYDTYDLAFVASDRFAAHMEPLTRTPVRSLHQAVDPERFRPTPGGPEHDILFVANARRARRKIIDDLAGSGLDVSVYGSGWSTDLIDLRWVRGEHVPNDQLSAYYSGAGVVLNDHWPDMRDWGFLSNRLYDALACGACVVSDPAPGIDEEFGGAVVTYEDPADLVAAIRRLLASPSEREDRGARGRAVVLAHHTFEQRANAILAELGPLLAARPLRVLRDEGRP